MNFVINLEIANSIIILKCKIKLFNETTEIKTMRINNMCIVCMNVSVKNKSLLVIKEECTNSIKIIRKTDHV